MERHVFKNADGENVEHLARTVVRKMLNDVRDVQDSTKIVIAYIDLYATTDDWRDPSAWWKTIGSSITPPTFLLDRVHLYELYVEKLVQIWRKAPEKSFIELTISYH